jgi:EAL domain-containing protein (putative c-di-GMP-specific phosphodiesterase class I)
MQVGLQPIINLKTNKTAGADVLSRLATKVGSVIAPAEFLPIAEANGFVSKIDIASLSAAGRLYENYGFSYFKNTIMRLNVFLSEESVKDANFPQEVKKLFERYKIPKNFIGFEIPYKVIAESNDDVKRLMKDVSDLGIVFECLGYHPSSSSFDALKSANIMNIKTHRFLIEDAVATSADYGICARFLDAASRAGYTITVAGIDNAEQRDLALHLKSEWGEGYYFSRPLLENDFIKLLLNYGK